MTTPCEETLAVFPLPFELSPAQQALVNDLANRPRSANYSKVGTGKTAMATVVANYQRLKGIAQCHIITCPPILIPAWTRWLNSIPGVSALAYAGGPMIRRRLHLVAGGKPVHHFYVMSLAIFKKDIGMLTEAFRDIHVGLIVDEATAVKNIESMNYRTVRDFSVGRPLHLLTGTPLSTPEDAYAYVKQLAPDVYRNKASFDSIHVGSRDIFRNVTKWENLDLLRDNMRINTNKIERIRAEGTDPIYDPIIYELHPDHLALYNRIAEEQLLELESGEVIDATSVSKLFTCMQQLVMNWAYFSGEPSHRSAGYDLLDLVLEQLETSKENGRKLVIFANYKMTMAGLVEYLKPHKARLVNGDVTPNQRLTAVDDFVNGDSGVILIQPRSGGYGLDGLQHVSSDVLFLECPSAPIDFEQSVGRVDRTGQTRAPQIRIAVANRTLQVRLHQLLLKKEELTNYVQGGIKSLRSALYGGSDNE